ncbi:hypothetical protein ACM16X_02615 [Haloarcula japonica]|uniref:hypothetical protein n=1 Tax=Haloarcula japonica TaxID=29282 RepID=UPI0039F6AB50
MVEDGGWRTMEVPAFGDYRMEMPEGVSRERIACEPGVEVREGMVVNVVYEDKICQYYGAVEKRYFEVYGFKVRF